jgi:hypothetical protein
MDSEDILSFCFELDGNLCVEELEGSGVKLPVSSNLLAEDSAADSWEYLCFICLWVCLKRGVVELPFALHNRMLLGPVSRWVVMYCGLLKKRRLGGGGGVVQAQDIFDLAS